MAYRLGIDVGGTHTDAVVLNEKNQLVAKTKARTTPDVTSGILEALKSILSSRVVDRSQIAFAMLGTTHCTNAIAERKRLSRVGVIRIGAPATLAIRPLFSWPEDLRKLVAKKVFIIHGGHEFDGREISQLQEKEINCVCNELEGQVDTVAITSVFSPVNPAHENALAQKIRERLGPDIHVTLSHEIGSLGLLERENATVLNAALVRTAQRAFAAFADAMKSQGIRAKLFFGQNDGTLMGMDYALRYPILTIASGPSNSLRGGAFLSNLKSAVVVDVGGTTTDVGALTNGFPRESSIAAEIGAVRTNFRMPDLISIGLGGGSLVYRDNGKVRVGPRSVGYHLVDEGLVFGGRTLTATDVAVSMGRAMLGKPRRLAKLGKDLIKEADCFVMDSIAHCIDAMKLSPGPVPVVLVGGGSILVSDKIPGASSIHRPDHFEVANAIGVAIAPISAQIDRVFSYEKISREEAIKQTQEALWEKATLAGADPASIELVELDEIALAYLPGNAFRIKAKAAGNLKIHQSRPRAAVS